MRWETNVVHKLQTILFTHLRNLGLKYINRSFKSNNLTSSSIIKIYKFIFIIKKFYGRANQEHVLCRNNHSEIQKNLTEPRFRMQILQLLLIAIKKFIMLFGNIPNLVESLLVKIVSNKSQFSCQ